jgi:hypothetical protein
MTTTFSVVSTIALVARERTASAVSLGSTVWLGLERCGPHPRGGGCLYRLAQHKARFLQKLFAAHPRFGDDVDRPIFQGLEGALRALLGQAGTDHHRYRVLRHDLLQEGQAIHARHLDVERDHIRHLLG